MKRLLPVKVVCRRCQRTLARFGDTDSDAMAGHRLSGRGEVFTTGDRHQQRTTVRMERSPSGEARLTIDCRCRAHIVVKTSAIAERARAGETIIDV